MGCIPLFSLVAIGLLSPLVFADWEPDPRCLRRLLLSDNKADFVLDERMDDGQGTDLFIEGSSSTSDDENSYFLRGNSHYNLTVQDDEDNINTEYTELGRHRVLGNDELLSFNMKLHWFVGACWQEEWREREWCMQCEGSKCEAGDILWLQKCFDIPQQRFQWIPDNSDGGENYGRLKTAHYNLCLDKVGRNTFELALCSNDSASQILIRSNISDIFELYPNDDLSKCVNNHHHPKAEEEIITTLCSTARRWNTNNWEIYWPNDAANGPDGERLFLRNPQCSYWNPCGRCEGDCDNDADCEGSLQCFQRGGDEDIPGCKGEGSEGRDYCYENSTPHEADGESLFLRNPQCSNSHPCGICEGDCDSDTECEGSLQCFQREAHEDVPGCKGRGGEARDYCYENPFNGEDLYERAPHCSRFLPCGRCEGDCDSDAECKGSLQCFQREGNEDVPGCSGEGSTARDYCYENTNSNNHNGEVLSLRDFPCSNSQPCGRCQGNCDSDADCEGNFQCFQREANENIPGCSGEGSEAHDYCYENSTLHNPDGDSLFLRNPQCSSSQPCGKCEGDCDSDSECEGSLRCFYRQNNEVVPGCSGEGGEGRDYCYEKSTPHNSDGDSLFLRNPQCSSSQPCGRCEGDCDSDSECEGSLRCFYRQSNEVVPGCSGEGGEGRDYCYENSAPHNPDGDSLFLRNPQCTSSQPCGRCEGDCDSDSECEDSLRCFFRQSNEVVPGCSGEGGEGRDYCYENSAPHNPGGDSLFLRNPQCSSSQPCGRCEGDCDSDSECEGSLRCFYRQSNEVVPGCSGEGGEGRDFCFQSTDDGENLFLRDQHCSELDACGRCEGDCDNDNECDGDLRCYQRTGYEHVPGCGGHGRKRRDYCYEQSYTSAPDELRLRNEQCTDDSPCEMCEGDCDNDIQCENELLCFQRTRNEVVPGCSGHGVQGRDYCVPPIHNDHLRLRLPSCSSEHPCVRCEGDCHNDDECEGSLKCFHRNFYWTVPGCQGAGALAKDYCYGY